MPHKPHPAAVFFRGALDGHDRAELEGLINQAVARFRQVEDDGKREEFRQLLRSYTRFYSFVAQVVRLDDTDLEKLDAYAAWLLRLLPNREIPPDIEITDDMLRLQVFKIEQKEEGVEPQIGGSKPLPPIYEFGAKPYTPDEERSLSEIIEAFNERHGTTFSREDFLKFERVNRAILDENMTAMLRNNPPDVAFSAFSDAFFQGAIRLFQSENEMRNIVMSDSQAREQAIRHFFNRALREVREQAAS
jgi:type I restriction enzyme, R subunit